VGGYREKLLAAGRREAGDGTGQGKAHALVPAESLQDGVLVDANWVALPGLQDMHVAAAAKITEQVPLVGLFPPLFHFVHINPFVRINPFVHITPLKMSRVGHFS
jgi:hypothetical protein